MKQRRSPKRTVSVSLRARGQTTQDFVVGIGVFLLAVAFVFSYVPSLITPYASYGGGESAQADRIAATVVDDLSENPDRPNHLNGSAFVETYEGVDSFDLAADLGLRATDTNAIDRVNVSLERTNQSLDRADRRVVSGGDAYTGQDAASSARIVTVDFDEVDENLLNLLLGGSESVDEACEPSCRLVVRVW